jgi:FKBP-type peptidyl-prolyl cis-trans isomerase
MKRKNLVLCILVAVSVGMASCMKSVDSQDEAKVIENDAQIVAYLADSIKAVKDPSGYYFIKRKTNPLGDSARLGDEATVALTGYLIGSKTVVTADTVAFPAGGNTLLYGVELAIRKVLTGEKATLFLPYYLAFGNSAKTNIPAYSAIRMEMEFIKKRTEVQQINDFLLLKKFKVKERTPENLVIVRTDSDTTSPAVGPGKSVTVKYIGKFLNDVKFDEGSFTYNTGTGNLIAGFDQAVQKLPLKGKAIVVFPSALGYKGVQYNTIPPYSPLQFELEIQ